jgi:hypothetical protein
MLTLSAGFWNLIGSIGFLLCGAFGYSINSGMKYQSSLSTFWGSWAFLIASTIMMFEVVFREPPETLPPTAQPDSSALPA